MIRPFTIIIHALRLWWRDWIGMILLNILWLALQIPIVTGPPATAVLYAIAQRIHRGEYWEMQELWPLLRELFWPAWRWALPNGLFLGVLAVNLYAYQNAEGAGWLFLRLVWGNAAGDLAGAKPVLLALLVKPGGQIAAGNGCQLRPFLFAESVTSNHPGGFLCCIDDGECVDHGAAGGRGGLFAGAAGNNGRSRFFGSTKRRKRNMKFGHPRSWWEYR